MADNFTFGQNRIGSSSRVSGITGGGGGLFAASANDSFGAGRPIRIEAGDSLADIRKKTGAIPPKVASQAGTNLSGQLAPTSGGGGALSETLAQRLRDAENAIETAFQASGMSEQEKNDLLTQNREFIEAQVEAEKKSRVESSFGRANVGAINQDIGKLGEFRIGEIARGRRNISQREIDLRRTGTQQRFENISSILPLPGDNFTQAQTNVALGGRLPSSTLRETLLREILSSRN